MAEAFHNKGELDIIITEQMANAWVNIESHKKIFSICENAIGYLKINNLITVDSRKYEHWKNCDGRLVLCIMI